MSCIRNIDLIIKGKFSAKKHIFYFFLKLCNSSLFFG